MLLWLMTFLLYAEDRDLPEVGHHQRLFTLEKNENPQNILIVYTRVDDRCHFVREDGKPVVDYYWLMDRARYKPTHALIKAQVRARLRVVTVDPDHFRLELSDIRELKVPDARFEVRSAREGGLCVVRTVYPSERGPIAVDGLFTESRKTFLPPFRKLVSVTVRGLDEERHEVRLKY